MSSMSMGADLDFAGFYALRLRAEPVTSLPATADEGRVVQLTTDGHLYLRTGGAWHQIAHDVDASLSGVTAAALRDRATHTGTQPASTISDLHAAVAAYPVSDFAPAAADLALAGHKITGLAAGTAASDAASKAQLDAVEAIARSAASGHALKSPVRAVSTAPITLSGLQTVDTVALAAGDRVLVAGQSAAADNGIYVVASGAWTRADDADDTGELVPGTIVTVTEGSPVNADTRWGLVSDAAVTIGTTAQAWARYDSGTSGEIITAGAGLTKTGTTLDVGAGTGVVVAADTVSVDTTVVARRYAGPVPSGSSPITITHGLGTEDVSVTVREVASGKQILVPWNSLGTPNSVRLEFGAATVASGAYRVLVLG